jgi:hypothetical protein
VYIYIYIYVYTFLNQKGAQIALKYSRAARLSSAPRVPAAETIYGDSRARKKGNHSR